MPLKAKANLLFIFLTVLAHYIDFSHGAVLSNKDLKKYKHLIEGQGLYTPEDDVTILTAFNFDSEIYGKNYSSLVEFYNSWCGFCQRFAPSYKALATEVKEWKSLISVAAIDCSDDDNSQMCRDFEIMSYPTLRYFHEDYKAGPANVGVDVEKGDDVYSHKKILIKRIVQEQKEGRGGHFPAVQPFASSNIRDLYNGKPTSVKYIFLVFEDPKTILGAELAFDLKSVQNISVRYVQNNTDLVSSMQIKKLPALVVIDGDNSYRILQENVTSKELARSKIGEYLLPFHIELPPPTMNPKIFTGKWINANVPDMSELMEAREREALRQKVKKMGDVVFQADLETALRYSFKLEVASAKTISGERLKALVDYVSVLVKYFPFGFYGREFLIDLKYKISQAGEVLQGSDVYNWIRDAESEERKIFSSQAQWIGCQGSAKNFRGYPCGLWKLFHYLTVSAAEHNSGSPETNPKEVLDAMHGYIKHFFGCNDCSRHFQEMAIKKDMAGVTSLDTAILWLWMAHNEVNKRLSGDATEDPEFPKVQFPMHERCPVCTENKKWNLQEVLSYLKQVYSSINIRYIGSDTRILHMGLEGASANGSSIFFFKNSDPSMCLLLYVICFLLLILLIRMFLKRGYKKKMYVHDLLGKV